MPCDRRKCKIYNLTHMNGIYTRGTHSAAESDNVRGHHDKTGSASTIFTSRQSFILFLDI